MLWNSLENPTEDNTGGVFNSILFSFTHSPAVKIIDSDVDLSFIVAFTNRDYKGVINVSMDNINLSEPGLLHIQRISNIGLHPTMVSLPDSYKNEINDDITITQGGSFTLTNTADAATAIITTTAIISTAITTTAFTTTALTTTT